MHKILFYSRNNVKPCDTDNPIIAVVHVLNQNKTNEITIWFIKAGLYCNLNVYFITKRTRQLKINFKRVQTTR